MRGSCFWKRVLAIAVLSVLVQVGMLGGIAQAQNTATNTAPSFIPVVTWNYEYTPFPSAQESVLAQYSFVDIQRDGYKDNLGRNTWQALKALNPTIQVYLYQLAGGTHDVNWDHWRGVERSYVTNDSQDLVYVEYVNTINRWNNARGLSMGNLNQNNPDLFLLDSHGNRICDSYRAWYLDFGIQKYVDYWVAAATADITRQPWKADGIFIDGPGLAMPGGLSGTPAKYPTQAAWAAGAVYFMENVSAALHAEGVKAWFNAGPTTTQVGQSAWRTLDISPNHPDALLDEGTFVVSWVPAGVLAGFRTEAQCKSVIDTMQSISKISAAMASSSTGLPGATGVDNFGKPVTYWDAFYFGLSCFLLGKNTAANNSYFVWHDANQAVEWFSEYNINLGAAKGTYQVTPYGTSNIYWREYQNGYVYVNLSNTNANGIVLGDVCRQITHQNVTNPFSSPTINTLDLQAHRAAILVRSSATAY